MHSAPYRPFAEVLLYHTLNQPWTNRGSIEINSSTITAVLLPSYALVMATLRRSLTAPHVIFEWATAVSRCSAANAHYNRKVKSEKQVNRRNAYGSYVGEKQQCFNKMEAAGSNQRGQNRRFLIQT
uniref:Uncharacterized protein n=1 Tax=Knipowitschia caucasica TaxID=637954 RepID=A0AAV2KX41_KNICA